MNSYPAVAVIANGEIIDYSKTLEKLKNYQFIIAADGGAVHCFNMGVQPHLLMGDFDSISNEALTHFSSIQKISFPKDKDMSDLELALIKAFSINPEKVTLFGATGNRIDHTLVNLHLLRRFPKKLFIETDRELIFAINAPHPFKFKTIPGQTVSFLPLGENPLGVETKGLKWDLQKSALDENFFSLSNICLGNEILISLQSGDLLAFLLFSP